MHSLENEKRRDFQGNLKGLLMLMKINVFESAFQQKRGNLLKIKEI